MGIGLQNDQTEDLVPARRHYDELRARDDLRQLASGFESRKINPVQAFVFCFLQETGMTVQFSNDLEGYVGAFQGREKQRDPLLGIQPSQEETVLTTLITWLDTVQGGEVGQMQQLLWWKTALGEDSADEFARTEEQVHVIQQPKSVIEILNERSRKARRQTPLLTAPDHGPVKFPGFTHVTNLTLIRVHEIIVDAEGCIDVQGPDDGDALFLDGRQNGIGDMRVQVLNMDKVGLVGIEKMADSLSGLEGINRTTQDPQRRNRAHIFFQIRVIDAAHKKLGEGRGQVRRMIHGEVSYLMPSVPEDLLQAEHVGAVPGTWAVVFCHEKDLHLIPQARRFSLRSWQRSRRKNQGRTVSYPAAPSVGIEIRRAQA